MKHKATTSNILNEIPHLTKNEIIIINFVNNFKKSSFILNIEDFSRELNTSASAITRFIKKYGFKTYKDFVIYFNKCLTKRDDETPFENSDDKIEHSQILMNKYKKYVDFLMKEENQKEIQKLTIQILKSNRVLVFGIGSSALCARELSGNLSKIGLNAYKNDDMHLFISVLGISNNQDLLIIVSNKMSNIEIRFIIKVAKENNVKIAFVTSTSDLNLLSKADIKINYKRIYNTKKFVSVSSKVYQLLISDIIFEDLLNSNVKLHKQYERSQYYLNLWNRHEED